MAVAARLSRKQGAAGFELIERIIAVAMMAILAAAMVPNVVAQLDRHREEPTRAEMAALYRAIAGDPARAILGTWDGFRGATASRS